MSLNITSKQYGSSDRKLNDPHRAAEQRSQALFEQAAVGLCLVSLDGHWLQVNDRLCSIVGYTREELLQQTFQDITYPPDLGPDVASLKRLVAGEITTYTLEKRYVHKNGTPIWISVTASLARDANGTPDYVVGVIEDIGARKSTEAALRLSEARSRVLSDAIPQLMWILNPDGTVDHFNRRWYEFTGLPEDGSRNPESWMEIVHPADRARVIAESRPAFDRGDGYTVEYRLRRGSGEYCWHLSRTEPLLDEAGTILAWYGTATDIDARKRAEEGLRFLDTASDLLNSSLDYETTLASLTQLAVPQLADWCAVDILTPENTLRRVAVAHIDPAKVVLAQEILERWPPRMDAPNGVPNVIRTGQSETLPIITDEMVEQAPIDPDLKAMMLALTIRSSMVVPLRARGETFGAISFVSAESGRHFDDRDLAQAEELARRAGVAMDNARQYLRAQDAVREREALLSVASHELKNPLTSLLGYGKLLKRSARPGAPLTDREVRAVGIIVDQGERLNRMLDLLLDLSRIEAGRLEVDHQPVELDALLARLADETRVTLKSHSLAYERPPVPVVVLGDELRLDQVFRNLLTNAIKYSPAGGPLTITLTTTEQQACVSLQDAGIGIPAEAIPRLFGRFYRVPGAGGGRIGGLGVGLYVVRQIVTLHGGTVQVTSTEGKGSTFQVCLPLP
jgi:PAS domain S-box-containing protein